MKGTKALILRSARKLFGKHGLTSTSMDGIAADAKIGKGTIYHYYDSKEKLFIEVAENEVEALRKSLADAVDKVSGPEEKLRAYIMARIRLISEVAKIFSMFKQDYIDYYAYIKKIEEKFNDFETSNLKSFIVEANEKGIFGAEDPDFTVYALSRWIHAMEYFFGTNTDQSDLEKKAGSFLNMLINGLKKR